MAHFNCYTDDEPEYNPEEDYSPTDWDKDPNESQNDYDDRMEDLNNYLEGL